MSSYLQKCFLLRICDRISRMSKPVALQTFPRQGGRQESGQKYQVSDLKNELSIEAMFNSNFNCNSF